MTKDYKQLNPNCPYAIVVIGTSLGGLQALAILLPGLPKNFPLPVAIVQHRHKSSRNQLSSFLQRYSALPIKEVEDKAEILPGQIYLAPADYHLLIEVGRFALSTEAPVCYARPSIDVLFESAADAYQSQAIGIILTGASHDGARGITKIQASKGIVLIQEPQTAECPIMPQAAITALKSNPGEEPPNQADWILPLEAISPLLIKQICNFR